MEKSKEWRESFEEERAKMSRGRKKWSDGGGTSVATAIPPEAVEMVERVKEVVDRSDHEIYAALVACKMDPDIAATFLASLDTFDEVESKCKNKTETKETQKSRSEIVSSSSTCGFTADIHDGGPSISMHMSSSDFGVMHGKLVQEKDNGISTIAISSILSSGMAANNSSRRLIPQSDSGSINTSQSTGPIDSLSFSSRSPLSFQPNWSGAPAHPIMADTVRMSGCQGKDSSTPIVATAPPDSINTSRSTGPVDNFSFFAHPPFFFQQNWSRAPGRPTMADIVRMGRCQQKASSTTIVATAGCQSKSCDAVGLNESHSNSMLNQNTFLPVELNWESHSSHDHVLNVTEINHDPGGSGIQQTSHEELSLANQPSVSSDQIVSQIFDASANHADEPAPSSLHADGVDLSFLDDHQVADGITRGQNLPTKSIKSASASDRQVDNSGYGFLHVYGHHEGAPARPTMADAVRMVGHQGKASATPIVQTASTDSINTSQATGPVDNFSFSSRQPFSFQHNWSGAPARPTMADIVRMGRSKQKASSTTIAATDGYQSKSRVAEINRDPGGAGFRQHDEWSLADQPSVRSGQIVSEIFDASANYADEPAPSSLHADGVDLSFLDDRQVADGITRGQNLPTKSIKSASASDRQVDNSGYGFLHVYGHHEGAAARPTVADAVRMVGHQGKASTTPIVQTASTDSINTSQATGPVDNFLFSSRPPFSFQRNWSGAPARPTMADIVRMGRSKQKASSTTIAATDGYQSKSRVAEINCDPGGAGFWQNDEWSLADQPSVRSGQIVSEIFDASANYAYEPAPSILHAYGVDLSFSNDDQVLDGITRGQNLPTKSIKSASASDRQVDNSGYGFLHVQGHHEAEDAGMELSLATSNLQQLSLHEEHDTAPGESCHAVIIPEHLQVTNADCSCLSLGTSGSGITGPSTGAFIPRPLKSNLEVASDTNVNMPPIGQPDTRISKYHHEERIGPFLDDSISFVTGTSTDNYGMLSTPQTEAIRNDTFVALHAIQQNFPSASGYAFSNTTQPTAAAYTYRQANSHMQNLSAFSSAMAWRPEVYPTSQRPAWSMPNTSISSGSFLTQHPTLPSYYSQPTHPSGHHLPSAAIQQAYSASIAFQQSPAMLHRAGTGYIIPGAIRGIYMNDFAPLAGVASGHGGSWNSARNIRGRYRRRVGYQEGARGSQFIGANRFLRPRWGEYAPTWARGASTRTLTALPHSASFSFQGRNQHGGVRERQQASHFQTLGCPRNYGSQAGSSEEHQQHPSEGNFDVSR